MNYSKIESSIQWAIQEFQRIKDEKYEESMFVWNESLKSLRGIKYYEGEDYTICSIPRYEIQPWIYIGTAISLNELLISATLTTNPHFEKESQNLMTLLKDICS